MAGTQAAFPLASFPSSTSTVPVSAGTGLTISTAGTISLTTTAGAVGTYAFLIQVSGAAVTAGSTLAGSTLRYASLGATSVGAGLVNGNLGVGNSGTPSGTWQCMGYSFGGAIAIGCGTYYGATLWVRTA